MPAGQHTVDYEGEGPEEQSLVEDTVVWLPTEGAGGEAIVTGPGAAWPEDGAGPAPSAAGQPAGAEAAAAEAAPPGQRAGPPGAEAPAADAPDHLEAAEAGAAAVAPATAGLSGEALLALLRGGDPGWAQQQLANLDRTQLQVGATLPGRLIPLPQHNRHYSSVAQR